MSSDKEPSGSSDDSRSLDVQLSKPTLAEARKRIRERADLNAFISLSEETGEGPPVAVKDLIDVRNMITTCGGRLGTDEPAADDAVVIERLRAHGCVVVGKTNMHEFAFGTTGINPHFGTVWNPHNPERVAGGSSSGSAVAAATGMCAFAIGTDTGGSIRVPASLCGIVGIKPTVGTVDVRGVIPLAPSLDTVGPMAPDVRSAALALEWMCGKPIVPREPIPDEGSLRLAVPSKWVKNLDYQTAATWSRVCDGRPEIDFPEQTRVYGPALTIVFYEAALYHRVSVSRYPWKYGRDVLANLRRGLEVRERDYRQALYECNALREEVEDALYGWDGIIIPTTAWVAPRPGATNVREPLTGFTRPFSTTGHPVVVVPAPAEGLPVGIQIVGHFGEDAALVKLALALEEAWAS